MYVELLKMAVLAVLHFQITCQLTSTVPGTQTSRADRQQVLRRVPTNVPSDPKIPSKLRTVDFNIVPLLLKKPYFFVRFILPFVFFANISI